jgi:hypothetical protein
MRPAVQGVADPASDGSSDDADLANRRLDLLLGTQGWRRYMHLHLYTQGLAWFRPTSILVTELHV